MLCKSGRRHIVNGPMDSTSADVHSDYILCCIHILYRDAGAAESGGGSGASAADRFIDRVLRSAFERRSEFASIELSWLVDGCLPRLESDASYDPTEDGGAEGDNGYQIPTALAVGLTRELALRARGSGGDEDEGDGGGAESVAAVLAEYVSPGLLRRAIDA